VSDPAPPTEELQKHLAGQVLMTLAKRVNEHISTFSGWLLAAYVGAFSLVLARFPQISEFVDARYIKWALILLLVAFVVAVPARLMSAQVASAAAAHDDVMALIEKHGPFAGPTWRREYLSGLLPFPNRRMTVRVMKKVDMGDLAAGGRLIAKLSQWMAVLVWVQMFLGIFAAGLLLTGLKA
jgi:hypothetical protein